MTQIQKKHNLQEDMDNECDEMSIDGCLLDITKTEYEKEIDLLDRKCEDWVNGKIGDAKNVDR